MDLSSLALAMISAPPDFPKTADVTPLTNNSTRSGSTKLGIYVHLIQVWESTIHVIPNKVEPESLVSVGNCDAGRENVGIPSTSTVHVHQIQKHAAFIFFLHVN